MVKKSCGRKLIQNHVDKCHSDNIKKLIIFIEIGKHFFRCLDQQQILIIIAT